MGANQSLSGTDGDNNKNKTTTTTSTPDGTISAHVAAHQVVIFSKRTCGYCDAVKSVVAREARRLRRSVDDDCTIDDAFVVELDDDGAAELQAALVRRTGVSTVPQVFVGSRFVGGAVDTTRMANNGGLRLALIQAANCGVGATTTTTSGGGGDGGDGGDDGNGDVMMEKKARL